MNDNTIEIEVLGKAEPIEELGKPKRNRMREMPIRSTINYSDEQLVNIAKNVALDVTKLTFEHFDPSSASSVTAMATVLGQLAKIAQDDIKLKQDQEAQGQIAGAANAVAQIFTKVIDSANKNRPLEKDRVEDSIGVRLEDNVDINTVQNETFIGIEHIDEETIMNAGTDNEFNGLKDTSEVFKSS